MIPFRPFVFLGLVLAGSSPATRASAAEPAPARVDVLYFHRTLRCPGCLDMETFTAEAAGHFPAEQQSGRLVFRIINLDLDANRHYETDYSLETSSVIISRRVADQETAWTNLPTVWNHVGDKSNFIAYVVMEISNQLEQLR